MSEDEAKRDLAWEAMLEVCGYTDPITQTDRGRVNAALKELRAIYPSSTGYAIAVDIRARAEVYRERFSEEILLTPQGLVGNWGLLDPAAERGRPISAIDTPPSAVCETCDGLRMVLFNVRADGSEEMAPCPDCHPNSNAAGWWRYDGTRFNPPESRAIRAAMIRMMEGDA